MVKSVKCAKIGKMSHMMLHHHTFHKSLKLLPVNLMESTQANGTGGNSNNLCVNNGKGKLIYDFLFGKMSRKMLENYVQRMQSEVEKSLSG